MVFGIAIPTSLYIFMKCFLHLFHRFVILQYTCSILCTDKESVGVNFTQTCVRIEMWRGKGVEKIHLARFWIQCGIKCVKIIDRNSWCEYFIAEMMLEESTHTVLSEA